MSSTATKATVRHTGTVKWFSPEKGFGFITPANALPNHSGDVFIHINNVAGGHALAAGQKVTFVLANRKGKNQAEVAELA